MNTTDGTSELAIELVDVTKRFGKTTAVDGLSLSVKRGSTFGLIGPNGAGKSTTIKMLMGVLNPTSGRLQVLGNDVWEQPLQVKQSVGYVPESHYMDRWMRVSEVVGFCRSVYANWNDETCREMLDLFELDPHKKVKQLSKGMLGKLSLVLAVSHEPQLLVLDEPMAGLDPLAREEFLDGVLRSVCERGQTVLFSSHSLDDVQRVADSIGFLYRGRLILQSGIDELLAKTKRIQATLVNGTAPKWQSENLICQRHQGREWTVTVSEFEDETVQEVKTLAGVDHVEVIDIGLEDLFKDIVKGQRSAS